MVASDPLVVAEHAEQAREFLAKSREYLDAGELHQACEKGWGAAAHMAKAAAEAQGWQYTKHADFIDVLDEVTEATGDQRIRELRGTALALHVNYYRRERELRAGVISGDLDSIAELLDILAPLTQPR